MFLVLLMSEYLQNISNQNFTYENLINYIKKSTSLTKSNPLDRPKPTSNPPVYPKTTSPKPKSHETQTSLTDPSLEQQTRPTLPKPCPDLDITPNSPTQLICRERRKKSPQYSCKKRKIYHADHPIHSSFLKSTFDQSFKSLSHNLLKLSKSPQKMSLKNVW